MQRNRPPKSIREQMKKDKAEQEERDRVAALNAKLKSGLLPRKSK